MSVAEKIKQEIIQPQKNNNGLTSRQSCLQTI
jgi:hypothetical protein